MTTITRWKVSRGLAVLMVIAGIGITTAVAQNAKQPAAKAPEAKPAAAAPQAQPPAKTDVAPKPAAPAAVAPAAQKAAPAAGASGAATAAPVKKNSPAAAALAKQVRAAKASFVAVEASVMNAPWAALHRAAASLEARWNSFAPQNAAAWKQYLRWDEFRGELRKTNVPVDTALLADVQDRLTAGYVGLEKQPYRDTAAALADYLTSITIVQNQNLQQDYAANLDELAATIEAIGDDAPDAAQAAALARTVGWLQRHGQAPALVETLSQRYSQPNLLVDVSEAFFTDVLAKPVDETEPVTDNILGTSICGTGRTIGNLSLDFVESPERAEIHAAFQGTNYSRTVGHNRSAVIYSNGTTQLYGYKTIYLDDGGMKTVRGTAQAGVKNRITGYGSTKGGVMGKIVVKVASKKAPQKQGQAQQIAARHAEQRLSRKMDDLAGEMIERTNADYLNRFQYPLERYGAFPREINYATSDDALRLRVLQDVGGRLAAPGGAPQLPAGAGIVVRAHHSLVDNTAEQMLAGRRFDRPRLRDLIENQFGMPPPKTDDDTPFSITFADNDPITLSLADGVVSVTVRGKKFTSEDKAYEGMNITSRYQVSTIPDGVKLTRQGDFEIYPPNFRSGVDKLSLSQTALRRLLQRRFDKMLDKEYVREGILLEEDRGTLVADKVIVDDGWVTIGYKHKPVPQVADARAKPPVGAE